MEIFFGFFRERNIHLYPSRCINQLMHVVAVSYYKLGLFDVNISEPVIELNVGSIMSIPIAKSNLYQKWVAKLIVR
jgi:hypothetical protein